MVGFICPSPETDSVDGATRLLGAQVCLCGMTIHCVVCSVTRESSAPCGKELGLGSCVTVPEEPPAIPSSWSAYEAPTLSISPLPTFPRGPHLHPWSLALATKFAFPSKEKGAVFLLFPNKKNTLDVTVWRVMPCMVWLCVQSVLFLFSLSDKLLKVNI